MLDVVARLDGTGQLLIVGGGVLKLTKLGAVESDALGDAVNGFAADLTLQEQVNVNSLAGIDERTHPATPHGGGVAAFTDIEVSVVAAVHDDIVRMAFIIIFNFIDFGSLPKVKHHTFLSNLIVNKHYFLISITPIISILFSSQSSTMSHT